MSFSLTLSWAIKCSAVSIKNLYIQLFNPLHTHALEKIGPLIVPVMIQLFLACFLIFKYVLGILILLLTLYLSSPFQNTYNTYCTYFIFAFIL